ncbi:glutathione S-transferase [Eleftheria terrae]|uniref:glutathione S-transferase n=1 Tax=Eleftheria terrae TaxID=1597781 RepID=UPI00263BAF30|nr:glutathione S-transferase [Eleftheria terrae]WKB55683.1 glutathione S-transferase [Eleftheria terrae]
MSAIPGEHVLYGYKGSGSASIEAALTLARLPFRGVNAASWDESSELQALQAVNGLKQIPVLRWPDGTVMSESAAILIELGLRHPDSRLLPNEPALRARAVRGLVYIAANCYAAIGIIDYPERWTAATADTERTRLGEGARKRLHRLWENFADTFIPADGSPFLSGQDQPDGLDLLAAVVSKWSGARAHLQQARPGCHAALERVDRHPQVREVFERHWGART